MLDSRHLGARQRGWHPQAWVKAALLLSVLTGSAPAAEADGVILDANRYDILAGRYSVFAQFQSALQRTLDACGKGVPPIVPQGEQANGKIGDATRVGIERALTCEALRDVPTDSAARNGVLTESVWRAVMGSEPVPTVEQRTLALTLSFEGTDFGDKPEWNLCQDGLRGEIRQSKNGKPEFACYNEGDPCSFLTWGPRGATAGQGREIQLILWIALHRVPAEIKAAFGSEFNSLRRFFRLRGGGKEQCDGEIPLKQFVCAVWLDPVRRRIWDEALAALGRSEAVRKAYAELYASEEIDGMLLRAYYDLWSSLGLSASEVDYAFFFDRITHFGGPRRDEDLVNVMNACIKDEQQALTRNGAARRCLSRLQPHRSQPEYRLGRDVAYYLEAYPRGALSEQEIKAWGSYMPLSAVHNFGLSDARPMPLGTPVSVASLAPKAPRNESSELTRREQAACPRDVLWPIHSKPPP